VVPNSEDDREILTNGYRSFLGEARTLAQFVHPYIVRVRDFFTANNTGDLVMDCYDGVPLGDYLAAHGGTLSADESLRIIAPILEGLEAIHNKGFLHRDIKPQNIYLTRELIPILLDFGAARLAVGEKSQSLSVIPTPGYAPYEQYHSKGHQGPWTDIYALGAALYYMLTGKRPPDALERMVEDDLIAPNDIDPRIPQYVSAAVLGALKLSPTERPQSAGEFLTALSSNRQPITNHVDGIDDATRYARSGA
jgi:serine/threonine protein kinase